MSLATQYTEVLAQLYQGTVDDRSWDGALMRIAALVGGEGPLLMSSRENGTVMTRYHLYSYDPAMFADYANHWLAHDPRVPLGGKRPQLTPFTEECLLGRHGWRRTPILNEFLRPNDAPWVLASALHGGPERSTLLCIQGTRARGPFDADDADMIRPLMPHLRRALEIKDRLEHGRQWQRLLGGIVDRLPFGVVLLDARQRVLTAYGPAAAILEQAGGMPLRTGGMLPLPRAAQDELARLLDSGLARGQLTDGLLHVSRGPDRLPVSILPAPAMVIVEAWIHPTPRWVLLVFDPEQDFSPSAALIERDLGLSRREAEIVALLAAGLRPPQIARRLGISLNTLRTHFKACFSKTGCRSQAELVRNAMSGPGSIVLRRPCRPDS